MKMKRKICLLIALVLLFANLLMPSVYAADDDGFVDWDVASDGASIFRDEKKFVLYQSSRSFYLDPKTVYCYGNDVDLPFEEDAEYSCSVYAPTKDAEFVWVQGYSNNYLYVTSVGKSDIDAFLNGTSVKYTLESGTMNADISNEEIKGLDDASRQPINAITVDVTTLESQERYDVIARDGTYTLAYVHGAIYYIDNQYYYLNYQTLGNNYFDADGNFSYRSGSVPLTPVDAMTASVIDQTVQDLTEYTIEYTYENDYDDIFGSGDYPYAIFWVIFVFLGFIAPIPLLVLGIVLPIVRKKKDGKRWWALAILAGLWLLLAAILGIVLII